MILTACAIVAWSASGMCTSAHADGFDVRPVLIETRDGLASIVITNPGERRIYLETLIYDWSQDANGQESLTESNVAIASPPAMWVSPRSTYNLRIKLPEGIAGQEQAYRVIVRQLPDRSDIATGHIVFALSQNLPAFVSPTTLKPAHLHGRLVDANHVLIVNEGARRVRLANLKQDGRLLIPGLVGYSLARSARAIELPAPIHVGTIEVQTDNGHLNITVR